MKTRSHRLVALPLLTLPALLAISFHTGCSAAAQDEGEPVSGESQTLQESAVVCDPLAPFGAPTRVFVGPQRDGGTRVIPGDMTSARLTADESTIYVDTGYQNESSKGAWDLVTGHRASNTAFGQATWLQGVNSSRADRWPSVSSDNLTLAFASDRTQSDTSRIFLSQRSSPSVPFGQPREISGLTGGSLDSPFLFGNELWFQAPSGKGDLYRTTLTNGVAGPATPAEFNRATATEMAPVLSADGLLLFFASTFHSDSDGGQTSQTDFDIYAGTRNNISEPFTMWWMPVIDLNSASDEWPTWVSPDGCRLYFVSKREGTQAVYVAAR